MSRNVHNLSLLVDAMENHEIALKFRPIVEINDSKASIFGIHVEPEWPNKDEIDYESVFQLVEKNRLSAFFDYYFIDLAIETIISIEHLRHDSSLVYVTACLDSFSTSELIDKVIAKARETEFDLSRLVLCLRDRIPSSKYTTHMETIRSAVSQGIKFCGVHTHDYPIRTDFLLLDEFSQIKVNSTLTHLLSGTPLAERYLHNFYDTARNLNKEVIVFGIDTERYLISMRANGYHLMAGDYFSEALRSHELSSVMAHWQNQSAHLVCRSEFKERAGLFQNKQLKDLSSEPRVLVWPKLVQS